MLTQCDCQFDPKPRGVQRRSIRETNANALATRLRVAIGRIAAVALIICAMGIWAAVPTFWTLPTGFLTGSAAAGGIALINSIGNLDGFAGPYAIGWIKDATGETTLGLVVLAACSIMAGVVTFLIGHDSKIEMAGSRMMAE
jgi:MFS transporter, ACS family, tartrate transporter